MNFFTCGRWKWCVNVFGIEASLRISLKISFFELNIHTDGFSLRMFKISQEDKWRLVRSLLCLLLTRANGLVDNKGNSGIFQGRDV